MFLDIWEGHMVHLLHHLADGAVGDDHHPGRVVGNGEIRQEFSDEFDFIVEIVGSN